MKAKHILIAIVSLLVLVAVVNPIIERRKRAAYKRTYEAYIMREREKAKRNDSIAKIKNDSIATMHKQRLEEMSNQKMNSTIFAGLRFGDSPETVKKALPYDKAIQVPVDDKVEKIYIKDYDAKYYNGKLASLTLYADETHLFNSLCILFTTKYGEGVDYKWTFSNCKIALERGKRKYRPQAERTLYPDPYLYYKSYRGEIVSYLTHDPYFIKITYEDNKLTQMAEREKFLADSLENVKRLEAIEKEKELARKLATEVSTDI